ncbi:toxin-antitoxin system YwqK family antitoxin [Janthinobacterium sp. Mn2066]|uniref:toxin-antitoxin system YwqK family antitoxin n=1 Tax=Janthinobacterium sp. Mn2066 TaxID=3395264 RepID=UPI003BCB67AE
MNGKEQGLWRDYYPDGKFAAEGHYEHGVEVGEWKYWDNGGVYIQETGLASEKADAAMQMLNAAGVVHGGRSDMRG